MATTPRHRNVKKMSTPELVTLSRKLSTDAVRYKLLNDGAEPPAGLFLQAMIDELRFRHVEIHH